MKFNEYVEMVFSLDAYHDGDDLLDAINKVRIRGGETNIAGALRYGREVMFSKSHGARPGVPKILILVTDGTSNLEESNTLQEANLTKAANVIIYTVGVTDRLDRDLLQKIASYPEYYFFVSHFTQLHGILQELINRTCTEAVTTTKAATRSQPKMVGDMSPGTSASRPV